MYAQEDALEFYKFDELDEFDEFNNIDVSSHALGNVINAKNIYDFQAT